METALQVADFKANFSAVLDRVRDGDEIVLSYGRKKEKVAVLVPYEKYRKKRDKKFKRKAGTLEGKGEVIFMPDFKITDEEFFTL
jgi:prevent-host-death family protein